MELPFAIPEGPVSRAAGVLSIVAGIIAILFPAPVFRVLAAFFALVVLLVSAGLIARGLRSATGSRSQRAIPVLCGIAGLTAGLGILFLPGFVAIAARDLIAAWTILAGIATILYGFGETNRFERGIRAVTGLVAALAGLLMVAAPAVVTDTVLVVALGFVAVAFGILAVFFGPGTGTRRGKVNAGIYK